MKYATLILFFAAALIVIFKGSEQSMLPLYALGVFISFTLSQSGMVNHWLRERKADEVAARIREQERQAIIHQTVDPSRASHEQERLAALEKHKGGHWLSSILINGTGALVTFIVVKDDTMSIGTRKPSPTGTPPTNSAGSRPASVRMWPTSDVVVVLPWVPASTIERAPQRNRSRTASGSEQ